MPNYLAVYGSMRSGAGDRTPPPLRNVQHLGPCRIPGQLYIADGYPALKLGRGTSAGDLFELPFFFDFTVFDIFEDYSPRRPDECWYLRRRLLMREPRVWTWASIYTYKFDPNVRVASSDWVGHVRTNPPWRNWR